MILKEPALEHGQFDRERRAFGRLKPQLLETHRGQYVVIRGGKAVSFGPNKAKLAKETYERFGYGPVYIGLVEQGPETVHIRTPSRARRRRDLLL